jgi:hypothetical protein
MVSAELLAVIILGLIAVGLLVLVVSKTREAKDLKNKYSGIVDVDAELAKKRAVADAELSTLRLAAEQEGRRRESLMTEYAKAKSVYEELSKEVRSLEENLDDISFGLYKPHYKYDTPEEYKTKLEDVRDKQKQMVKDGEAARFDKQWTVGGSAKEGERMQKQYQKLMLRAFNGECDAAVAKVTWNNVTKMEERISKAFDAINTLGGVMTVSVTKRYMDLKIAELRLEYELEEKKREASEEQKRIREEMKEEEKLQREAERAKEDAEADEVKFQKALEKAKVEFGKTQGAEHSRLNEKILELQAQLEAAQAKAVKAKAMAELTKGGYVYIISNVGSFGEGVFKIGMTRRLEPMDRVKELGDASVPFSFDVHAMVYSEDAPTLENALHKRFAERQINLVNGRKEFFKVDLAEVEAFTKEAGYKISYTKIAEAREYRESIEIRRERGSKSVPPPPTGKAFPAGLFS